MHRGDDNSVTNKLKEKELKVAEGIARVLIHDLSVQVRKAMAQELMVCSTLPSDIIERIATDVESVAAPFLKVSDAFTEQHLVDLISVVDEFARISIAQRKSVSGAISIALIEFSSDETITVLLRNDGAEINQAVCDKMLERYDGKHSNMEMLVSRIDLPSGLAKNLAKKLASSYIETIDENYMSSGSISDHIGNWANNDPTNNIMGSKDVKEVEQYVKKLRSLGRLTPEIILNSLTYGNKFFFEAAMTILTDSNNLNISRLITHGGLDGLQGLLYKAKIPNAYLKRFSSVLGVVYRRTK